MQQIKAVLELRFKNVAPVFQYKNKVLEALGVDADNSKPTILENIDLDVSEQFAHVTVEGGRVLILIERAEKRAARKFIVDVIGRLEKTLSLSSLEVTQMGYRCMFIREGSGSFDQMVQQIKDGLFKSVDLIDDAYDVASPLTFKVNECRVNFIAGAMEQDQLKSTLNYPPTTKKKVFLVDIDFIRNNLRVTARDIDKFISETQDEQKKLIDKWEAAVIYE